jgi:hypothetical protein
MRLVALVNALRHIYPAQCDPGLRVFLDYPSQPTAERD